MAPKKVRSIKEYDQYQIYCPPLKMKDYLTLESVESYLLYEVRNTTSKPAKKALMHVARNFQREFRYDFKQYSETEFHGDKELGAFLWAERCDNDDFVDYRVIGGACFRYREKKNFGLKSQIFAGWALQWIYLHPNNRRQGLLNAAWKYFTERYNNFIVEEPISTPMLFFLAKNGFPSKAQNNILDTSPGPKGTMWRGIKAAIGR